MVELLDFYADWCGPCVVMKPVLEELEKEMASTVKITKIDVDQKQEEASKYGVMSIPTYVILKDGKEVDRFIGATSKQDVVSKLNAHLS